MKQPLSILACGLLCLASILRADEPKPPKPAADKPAAPAADNPTPDAVEDYNGFIALARKAFSKGNHAGALEYLNQAIKRDPKADAAYGLRAQALERLDRQTDAIADLTTLVDRHPDNVGLLQQRGTLRFKAGLIKPSIEDFDKVVKLQPREEPHHWQRGICYYYDGRFKDGVRQFTIHQTVNPNDVENAVWRFMCQVKAEGMEAARKDFLKVGPDGRVPMKQIYNLFAGTGTAEDVLKAAQEGDPAPHKLKDNLFYAHQYLGLYYEAHGDEAKAKEHTLLAAEKYNVGHYMWAVAKVHADIIKRKEKEKKEQPKGAAPATGTEPSGGKARS